MRSLEDMAMVQQELIHLLAGPPITRGGTARNFQRDLEATARNRSDPDQLAVAEIQGAILPRFQMMTLTPRPLNRLMMMRKPRSVPQLGALETSPNNCKRSNPLAQSGVGVLRMRKISRCAWRWQKDKR
jgi:hypothetical protein